MESCPFHNKIHHFCSPFSISTSKIPSHPPHQIAVNGLSLKLGQRHCGGEHGRGWSRVWCAKEDAVLAVERELNAEMKSEEWMGIVEKCIEKCSKPSEGIVEMMECLEKEAIMGEDEGREPVDYSRRAQIFDKSSKVFQALKENNNM